jgi:hypothetical protein
MSGFPQVSPFIWASVLMVLALMVVTAGLCRLLPRYARHIRTTSIGVLLLLIALAWAAYPPPS